MVQTVGPKIDQYHKVSIVFLFQKSFLNHGGLQLLDILLHELPALRSSPPPQKKKKKKKKKKNALDSGLYNLR